MICGNSQPKIPPRLTSVGFILLACLKKANEQFIAAANSVSHRSIDVRKPSGASARDHDINAREQDMIFNRLQCSKTFIRRCYVQLITLT